MVVKRIDPDGDEKERAVKDAEAKKKREDDAVRREAVRRNSALLATYTSAQDIDDARSRALADNQKAVKDVELRIDAIKKRQASYDKELEFYKGDNKPPARLQDDIRDAEIDLQAQENLLAAKKKDADTINANTTRTSSATWNSPAAGSSARELAAQHPVDLLRVSLAFRCFHDLPHQGIEGLFFTRR